MKLILALTLVWLANTSFAHAADHNGNDLIQVSAQTNRVNPDQSVTFEMPRIHFGTDSYHIEWQENSIYTDGRDQSGARAVCRALGFKYSIESKLDKIVTNQMSMSFVEDSGRWIWNKGGKIKSARIRDNSSSPRDIFSNVTCYNSERDLRAAYEVKEIVKNSDGTLTVRHPKKANGLDRQAFKNYQTFTSICSRLGLNDYVLNSAIISDGVLDQITCNDSSGYTIEVTGGKTYIIPNTL